MDSPDSGKNPHDISVNPHDINPDDSEFIRRNTSSQTPGVHVVRPIPFYNSQQTPTTVPTPSGRPARLRTSKIQSIRPFQAPSGRILSQSEQSAPSRPLPPKCDLCTKRHAETWMCAAKKAVAAREQELLARIQAAGQNNGQRTVTAGSAMTERPAEMARTPSEMARTLPTIIAQYPPYPFYPSPQLLPGVPGPSNWYQRPPTYPPVPNYLNYPPTFYPPVYPPPYVEEGLGNGSNFAERTVLDARNGGMRQEFPPREYRP
ncbi:hypothetical protein M231_04473 [Tremella mesenterica]|uniref:Uncharacterized protein n=1 Tax=Tremella mesenterica TaxID=5217 RepID=A0A4Q1BKU4_TREME|nr:hypothetical protein M231_04473 [Tremella mesenterica]